MGRDVVRDVRLLGVVVAAVALTVPALASAAKQEGGRRSTTTPSTRRRTTPREPVVVFTRAANGLITQTKVVATGGKGRQVDAAVRLPDRRRLRVGRPHPGRQAPVRGQRRGRQRQLVPDHLHRARSSSARLVAWEAADQLGQRAVTSLYTVNETSANIYGWHFSSTGKLTPIAGSNRKLTAVDAQGQEGQGRRGGRNRLRPQRPRVAVTQRGLPRKYGEIDTFADQRQRRGRAVSGLPRPRTSTTCSGSRPSATTCW